MSDPYVRLKETSKGKHMHKATITFQDYFGQYTRTIEHDEQRAFYAILVGTINGGLGSGSHVVGMELDL